MPSALIDFKEKNRFTSLFKVAGSNYRSTWRYRRCCHPPKRRPDVGCFLLAGPDGVHLRCCIDIFVSPNLFIFRVIHSATHFSLPLGCGRWSAERAAAAAAAAPAAEPADSAGGGFKAAVGKMNDQTKFRKNWKGKTIQLNHEVAVAAADVDEVDAEPDLGPEPMITERQRKLRCVGTSVQQLAMIIPADDRGTMSSAAEGTRFKSSRLWLMSGRPNSRRGNVVHRIYGLRCSI